MNRDPVVSLTLGACYAAVALVTVAVYRREIAALIADVHAWHRERHPVGRMWDDIRSAANGETP